MRVCICVCVCVFVCVYIIHFQIPTSYTFHLPHFSLVTFLHLASLGIALHHTLQHTLQHTIQHILQHTLQHTLQHVLQHIPSSYTTTPLLSKTLSLPLATPTLATGWRRHIGCLKLQVVFCKRATNYRALLQKMTYKDKASYDSTPPCTTRVPRLSTWCV